MLWRYEDTETGLIMPWYTLPALQWLKKQDISSWCVFEYGAGYSTIWWRVNARMNFSVDHTKTWCAVAGYFKDSIYCDNKNDYIKSIETPINDINCDEESYDCIVVDGEWRLECAGFAMEYLNKGGYMIIDNYGQSEFPPTEVIDKLLEGWEKQVFKQPNHTDWCTAIFRKP